MPKMNKDISASELFNLAGACAEMGDFEGALKYSTKIIELEPANGFAFYYRGASNFFTGDYDNALKDFKLAIKLEPDYGNPYSFLGYLCLEKREYDKSIKNYDKSIAIESDNPIAIESDNPNSFFTRGSTYFDKKNYEKAIQDYTKVIELEPKNIDAHYYRGLAYLEMGDIFQGTVDVFWLLIKRLWLTIFKGN